MFSMFSFSHCVILGVRILFFSVCPSVFLSMKFRKFRLYRRLVFGMCPPLIAWMNLNRFLGNSNILLRILVTEVSMA